LLKKLILSELILIALVLIIATLRLVEGPKISTVKVNLDEHSINVMAKASFLKGRLEYSFDNGKTYQNKDNIQVQQPGSYIIVLRDNKGRKDVWETPVIFTDKDFEGFAMPAAHPPSAQAPQITGVEPINESIQGMNDGQIIIHTAYGHKPIRYSIDGGQSFSDDSIFSNLEPGIYSVSVVDNDSHIGTWPDPVQIDQGFINTEEEIRSQPPSQTQVESLLNSLFLDPENNSLRDSLQGYFVSQTMIVECELIGIPPNTPYQLFQFLQRRFEGQPGSKRIQVLDIGYDNMNRINSMRIRETRALSNR
jgi:hypothetical protein